MKLAVVILNWNGLADTRRTVEELAAWRDLRPHLIVVDNASQEREGLLDLRAHATLICNRTNLGFAGGTNRGVEAALAADADAVLLLNNDAHMTEEDLETLALALEADPSIGLVTPLLFDGAGHLVSAGGLNPVLHLQTRNLRIPTRTPLFPIEQISGTAALVGRRVWEEIGLLDERYFFSTEMADLCRRAWEKGVCPAVESRSRAVHDLDRSATRRQSLYIYYIIRNRFLYINNFYFRSASLLRFGWRVYGELLSRRLKAKGQSEAAIAVALGTRDGLAGRFGNQNERVRHAIGETT